MTWTSSNNAVVSVKFAGSGGAFAPAGTWQFLPVIQFTSAKSKLNILFDCGTDAKNSLPGIGLEASDIDAVYISHLHSDHCGGLEWLGFKSMYGKPRHQPMLLIPHKLEAGLWSTLRSGMKDNEKCQIANGDFLDMELSDFFKVQGLAYDIQNVLRFNKLEIRVTVVKVPHVRDLNKYDAGISHGLFIDLGEEKLLFTSDSKWCPEVLMPWYEKATFIFQDCADYETNSPLHAKYSQLKMLPSEIKGKMILCHHSNSRMLHENYVSDGFLRVAVTGKTVDLGVVQWGD